MVGKVRGRQAVVRSSPMDRTHAYYSYYQQCGTWARGPYCQWRLKWRVELEHALMLLRPPCGWAAPGGSLGVVASTNSLLEEESEALWLGRWCYNGRLLWPEIGWFRLGVICTVLSVGRCRMSGFLHKRLKSDNPDSSGLKNRLYPLNKDNKVLPHAFSQLSIRKGLKIIVNFLRHRI